MRRRDPPPGRRPGPRGRPAGLRRLRRPSIVIATAAALLASCSDPPERTALPAGPPIRIHLLDVGADEVVELSVVDGQIEVYSLSDSPVLRATIPRSDCRIATRDGQVSIAGTLYGKQLRLASSTGAGFRIAPGGDRAGAQGYRGVLDLIFYPDESKLRLINQLNLEGYIAGVVGEEMGGDQFPLEALKAQAVAARTYTLYNLKKRLDLYGRMPLGEAFPATVHFQSYGGLAAESPRILRATRETAGKVLTYGGRMFQAYYHSACGGRTASGVYFGERPDTEPLRGGFCDSCRSAPFYEWEVDYPLKDLGDVLRAWARARDVTMGELQDIVPARTLESGHHQYLKIVHTGGSFEMLTEHFRSLTGRYFESPVRSSRFEVHVDPKEKRVHFEGRGQGHGVGLCQYGAGQRARENESCGDILGFYYPKAGLKTVY